MYNKERKTKYAIRKLAVATVSLAIGTTVAVPAIVDSGQVAHAEEQGGTPAKAKYKVTYEFMTGTPGYELPTEINALLPDATESEDGYLITPQPPKQTTYVDAKNNGV